MRQHRWVWFTPVAFAALRIIGNQFVEGAVGQRDAPQAFLASLLADAESFSIGMYLIGLSGLAFLMFTWALREVLRQGAAPGWAKAGFAGGVAWGAVHVVAALLGATAPVLADYFDDAEGARLVTNLELATAPLALTLLGVFALSNGLALRRTAAVPPWLAWAGVLLGGLLIVTSALQTVAEPTASRSEEEVNNVVTFITGFVFAGLIPLWTIATGIMLFRGEGRRTAVAGRR